MSLKDAGKRVIQRAVSLRGDFTHGNLKGRKNPYYQYGRLPFELRDSVRAAEYVIYSYSTPIAWYTNGKWEVPDIGYSKSTTNHQNVVRAAIR